MHPILLSALKDHELSDSAKLVLSAIYAHTNGTLAAAIAVDELLAGLHIAESTLRRRRSELAAAGWLASRLDGDTLHVEILDGSERAPSARSEDEDRAPSARQRAPSARSEDEDRAPSARSEDEDRAPSARQRAPSARSEEPERAPSARSGANSVRADAQRRPPTPPQQGIVNIKQQQQQEITCCCSEGGAGETDARTAELLSAAGIAPHIVAELSRRPFAVAARHVAGWQVAAAAVRPPDPPLGVGALVARLRSWSVPEMTADQLQAGLLAGRVTDADLRAWRVKRPRSRLAAYDVPPGYEHIVQH